MQEWTPTGTGYELTIRDGAVVARNAKGRVLATVPSKARNTEAYESLAALLDFLRTHDAEVGEQVERWFLRSLPVPRVLLTQVWADEAWRSWLTDTVVLTEEGQTGFLRAADDEGLGVVDLDGESLLLTADRVLIPHPVLLPELEEIRAFAVELGVTQRLDQLFREIHRLPSPPPDPEVRTLETWAGGEFDQLRFAAARAVSKRFKISGGYATTTVWENGHQVVARYWIGVDNPDYETSTGELYWESEDAVLPVASVGPVAYSEGVRMAGLIYAGRKVEVEK